MRASNHPARLALITGEVGAGKTTAVGRIVELARAQGHTCAGVWSPARLENGLKTGIESVDLARGERRLLARVVTETSGQTLGRYRFDPAVLDWSNEVLARALAARPDLLVIDEIGPLELEQGGGLAPALPPLAAGRVPRALLVVRAWLQDALRARLPGLDTAAFTVTAASRDALPQQVLDWLFR
ncbi:MAG: nucleoside-triphosphatase [Chloroflexota bacterium]